MCLYVDDDRVHLDNGQRKARKPHRCKECGRTIDPGEIYRWWTVVDEGEIETEKMCAHCWNTVDLGASITGCPRNWWWGSIHDLRNADDGGFVADIVGEHTLTVAQARAMVRCVRGYRRRWRDRDGHLLPLVTLAPSALTPREDQT